MAVSQAYAPSQWDKINQLVYSLQDNLIGSSTESKVHFFVVVGGVLTALAVAGALSIGFSAAILSPLVLFWLLPLIPVGVAGLYLAGEQGSWDAAEFLQSMRPFVDGQPIGFRNTGNNCWINASLQVLLRSPAFQARMRQIPVYAQAIDACASANAQRQKAAPFDTNLIRQYLSRETNGIISPGFQQEDAAQLIETLFQNPNPLYRFDQLINGVPSVIPRAEPMVQLELGMTPRPGFQELFNRFFDHQTDGGARRQFSFQNLPDDLLIHMKRFTQYQNSAGQYQDGKIDDPIDIPGRIALPGQFVRGGRGADYVCEAFLVHMGSSHHGGHYVAYVYSGDSWWYASDATMFPVSQETVDKARSKAYICHYKKI